MSATALEEQYPLLRVRRWTGERHPDTGGSMTARMISALPEVGMRARRRVAYRLLPFVFLIYIVNYIDRVNVSFANLRMSGDLGFSDSVYGLGVGCFFAFSANARNNARR